MRQTLGDNFKYRNKIFDFIGWLSMASIMVGVVAHTSLYPVMLMVPVLLSTKTTVISFVFQKKHFKTVKP